MAATEPLNLEQRDSVDARRSSLNSNGTLAEIARSAQCATGASGAALVLSDGEIMSCYACSGDLTPPVGTRLNPNVGFTAICVQTAEVARCDDTAIDFRLRGSSCIELGIRSILAVPVFDGSKVAGVLEVLSSKPQSFTERHATALKLLARLVETVGNFAPRGNALLNTAIADARLPATETNAAMGKLMCLSCGHRNPQGSQFCNRCGVVMLASFGHEGTQDQSGPAAVESSSDEGLKKVYTVISEDAGRSTWNEISAKLLASVRTISPQPEPPVAANSSVRKEEPAKKQDAAGQGIWGSTEFKARLGAAVRRSLWL